MRRWTFAASFLIAVIAAIPLAPGARAARLPLAVIAHVSVKANDAHVNELRGLFLKQSEQLAGQKVIPVTYTTGHPLRVDFDALVLGMSADVAARYWVDARIRGAGSPPRSVTSPQLMLRVVASLPGTIGFVPKALVDGAPVKVLRIDGLPSL